MGFFNSRALDLAGAEATGADVNGGIGTAYHCLHLADVGLPGSVCLAVRVRHVVSESNALAANATFSHFNTSKNLVF